jgi:hypothetical protein
MLGLRHFFVAASHVILAFRQAALVVGVLVAAATLGAVKPTAIPSASCRDDLVHRLLLRHYRAVAHIIYLDSLRASLGPMALRQNDRARDEGGASSVQVMAWNTQRAVR